MVTAAAINPGVITSLDGGAGSATQPVQVYPPPDVIPPSIPLNISASPLLQTSPTSTIIFEAPKLSLPDISQIEQQLKATGALISEIPERTVPDDSPLAHLQPTTTQGQTQASAPTLATTSPIYSKPSPVTPLPPIKLASTAPTSTTLVIPPTPAEVPEDKPGFFSQLFKWGISGLSVMAVVAMGWMAYQSFVVHDANASLINIFTQFSAQNSNVEIDQKVGQPKAVWYQ
jgi:hypothetical protein